jgi:hypothetical protein
LLASPPHISLDGALPIALFAPEYLRDLGIRDD